MTCTGCNGFLNLFGQPDGSFRCVGCLESDLAAARAELAKYKLSYDQAFAEGCEVADAGVAKHAAESMRERAAKVAEKQFYATEGSDDIAAAIRALPLADGDTHE